MVQLLQVVKVFVFVFHTWALFFDFAALTDSLIVNEPETINMQLIWHFEEEWKQFKARLITLFRPSLDCP